MAAVKASRRRLGAVCALGVVVVVGVGASACEEGQGAHDAVAPTDCSHVLQVPRAPHIATVTASDGVEVGPACATANCLMGSNAAMVWNDGTLIHIDLLGKKLDLPRMPASKLHASPTISGVLIGSSFVLVDRGSHLELIDEKGSRDLPWPELSPAEHLWGIWEEAGGLVASARDGASALHRIVEIIPRTVEAPVPEARSIDVNTGERPAWFVPGDPAIIVDGAPFSAGMAIRPPATVERNKDIFIVRARQGVSLVRRGQPPFVVGPVEAYAEEAGIFALRESPVPSLSYFDGKKMVPFLEATATTDILGSPLVPGSIVVRVELGESANALLLIERVRNADCTTDDRLIKVDLQTRTAKLIASGDKLRLHPAFLGGSFRFIEADAEYRLP